MRPPRGARISRSLAVSMIVALGVVTSAGAQPKQPSGKVAETKPLSESLTGEAKTAYEDAKRFFRDGDFGEALLEFEKAHTASHDPRLLWNMAVCAKNLRRYARVLDLVERYLQEGGELLADADRQQAQEFSTAVQAFVGTLALTSQPPGASVFVDEVSMGTTPLARPLRLDPGLRRIRISRPGFKDEVRTEEVQGGARLELAITLEAQRREGRIVVAAGAGDAIALDGKTRGTGRWDGTVPAGKHELRISAPGKKTSTSAIDLHEGETRTVDVALEAEPGRGGVPAWVWIGGGAVLVAGAVVGGYFLFRPSTPAPVGGTLDGSGAPYQIPNAWRMP